MRALLVLFAVVAAAGCACAATVSDAEWEQFKATHSKSYKSTSEERYRREVYLQNKEKVEAHNERYARGEVSFKLGLNEFADMLHSEKQQSLRGLKVDASKRTGVGRQTYLKSGTTVNSTVDWRNEGLVTGVKNQWLCGCCWAFSATGSMEGQLAKKNKELISLSEQNLIDCSTENEGCDGGEMDLAFEWVIERGGIDTEKSYPYWGFEWFWCRYHARNSAGTISGYVDVTSGDEDALKEAVGTIGPVSVGIDASLDSFDLYESGIYYEESCSSTDLDHGVLVVGYGTEDDEDYWLVKNSWGKSWGLEGYIKMARNKDNNCGIATMASYPTVSDS